MQGIYQRSKWRWFEDSWIPETGIQEEVRSRDMNLEVINVWMVYAWRLGVRIGEWESDLLAE